jgi:5-methylcytosine-specific restriction endonuclease McrA
MFIPKRKHRDYRSNWLDTAKSDRQLLGLKCEKCGSTDRVQRHHIVSLNRCSKNRGGGGPDNLLNLQLLCYVCHTHAHFKHVRK